MKYAISAGRAAAWLLGACGVWLIGLGAYFIAVRPPLLPEDLRYLQASLLDVQAVLPEFQVWLDKVFTVMGGFIAGAGALTIHTARSLHVSPARGSTWAIGITGALTVGLMSAVNFIIESDYRWLLLMPALLWLAATVLQSTGDGRKSP